MNLNFKKGNLIIKKGVCIFVSIFLLGTFILGCKEKTTTIPTTEVEKEKSSKEKAIEAYINEDYLEAGKNYFKNLKESGNENPFMYSEEIKLKLVEILLKAPQFISMEDMNNKQYYMTDLDKDNIPEIIGANSLSLNIYKFTDEDFKLISYKLPSDIKSSYVCKINKDNTAIIVSNYRDIQEETCIYTLENDAIVKKLTFTAEKFENNFIKDIDNDGIYEIGEVKGDELSKTISWTKIKDDFTTGVIKKQIVSSDECAKEKRTEILSKYIRLSREPSDEEILSFINKAIKYDIALHYLREGETIDIDGNQYYKCLSIIDNENKLKTYYGKYFSKNFTNDSMSKLYKTKDGNLYVMQCRGETEIISTKVLKKQIVGDSIKLTIDMFNGQEKNNVDIILVLEGGIWKIDSGNIFIRS